MKQLNVLLCCGAGMSSGFLAQRTRVASKKRGISITVEARAESDVGHYISKIDILLVGPHFANSLAKFQQMGEPYHVPAVLIPHNIYATLDGDALLNLILETIEKKK
jgi:PTS system cellobiose-specific IIB component